MARGIGTLITYLTDLLDTIRRDEGKRGKGGIVSKQELRILYKQGKLTTKEYFVQLARILKEGCPVSVPALDVVEFFGDLDFPLKTGV